MFNIGFTEAIIIFLVALIVLGPEKLPEVGRFLGRLSIEIKKAIDELKRELELEEVEKDIKEAKEDLERLKEEVSDPIKLLDRIDPRDNGQTKSS
ncbi:MAG: Sec-independent protein translocase protein TatB [Caldimicrobium sp.]|nr:Sec-independent protein translocase protein TatB [Caldimicrobium sp.]MCX7614047.1 Sec-independent protein translocase protein TatB [Caldimicrobium sp.]MDW8182359.1 Sec-independent protein translocase protein TatB [Caldimicrobium sp.]